MKHLATQREFVIRRLRNASENWLSYTFEGFQMPDDAPYGEYSCILFYNSRKDTTFEVKDDLKETIIHTADGEGPGHKSRVFPPQVRRGTEGTRVPREQQGFLLL